MVVQLLSTVPVKAVVIKYGVRCIRVHSMVEVHVQPSGISLARLVMLGTLDYSVD